MKHILLLITFLLSNLLTSYSQDIDGMFNQGEQKKMAGEFHTAIGFYTKVLNSKPDHLNALLQRAFCHSAEKNYQSAIDDYTKVIAAHPRTYLGLHQPRKCLQQTEKVRPCHARF
jgi:tetratricopeptide (TPR) repeat protein